MSQSVIHCFLLGHRVAYWFYTDHNTLFQRDVLPIGRSGKIRKHLGKVVIESGTDVLDYSLVDQPNHGTGPVSTQGVGKLLNVKVVDYPEDREDSK